MFSNLVKGSLLVISLLGLSSPAFAKLKIVTTTSDLGALAKEVGRDLVEVKSLARGEQDPHYLEPKPSYALMMNQADLLIEVGLQLEVGWLPVLLVQSRNPEIQPGQPGHLIASEGVEILEIPTGPVDRSQGDVHPEGNPHYWLNPRNGLVIARQISERLTMLDPEHAPDYRRQFEDFRQRLSTKITVWENRIKPLEGREIITHHKSFSYFVDWARLMVEAQIEPKPGIPPSPAHILSLIGRIENEKIPLIITENYYDPRPARELSEKTGTKFLVLPTSVGGETDIHQYEDLFEHLIEKLTHL